MEVQRLYSLLSGNRRVSWTCGYHWNVLFEYESGTVESIDINEECEEFKRESDTTFKLLHTYFARANSAPTHHMAAVSVDPKADHRLASLSLEKFGTLIPTGTPGLFFLLSRVSWTDTALSGVRRVVGVRNVSVPQEQDLGN
jgi:hypothetical protein